MPKIGGEEATIEVPSNRENEHSVSVVVDEEVTVLLANTAQVTADEVSVQPSTNSDA